MSKANRHSSTGTKSTSKTSNVSKANGDRSKNIKYFIIKI